MTLPGITQRQVANARVIAEAAAPWGADAVVAALMTAIAESSLLRYANDGTTKRSDVPRAARTLAATSLAYDHDAVAPNLPASTPDGYWDTTADSIGHFQQRPMYGYGTVAELMDPAESTRIFIRGSQGGSGRTRRFLDAKDGDLAARCQWTQGSEYPTGDNYRPHEGLARTLARMFVPHLFTSRHWLDTNLLRRSA